MASSNSHVKRYQDSYRKFVQWLRWYPDLFVDLMTPKEGGIRLDLDQRVFMRAIARFVSTYGVFPRGYGKCVAGDTILFTENGMIEIGEYFDFFKPSKGKEMYVDVSQYVLNRFGCFEFTKNGVANGLRKTKKIRTKQGYELECSLNHKIISRDRRNNHDKWVKAEDLQVGDRVPINLKNDIWGKRSYDGNEIRDLIINMDYTKEIPYEILKSDKLTFVRYLKQLMDYLMIRKPNGYELVSLSNKLSRQIQLGFLNLGMIVKREEDKVYVPLEVVNNIKEWIYNAKVKIEERESGDYYIDEIASIEDSETYTYDISMTETHSYVSNGLLSHNTFIEILTMYVSAISYPNLDMLLTAQTKSNASSILKQKHTEIIKFYPLFRNEIADYKFSTNEAEVIFVNGSNIKIIANAQSSKGMRSHRANIEESALVDNDTYVDVIQPIPDIPRRTIGKRAVVNPYEPNGQINFFTTAGFKGTSEYERIQRMVWDMIDCQGKMVLTADWRLALHFGRGLTKSQVLNKKETTAPIAFAQNYESVWAGASDMALIDDIKDLMACRILNKPEFEPEKGYDYIVSVDVARSENIKTNNQTYVTVGKLRRGKDGTIKRVDIVNLMPIKGDTTFELQAIQVKEIVEMYKAKTLIVDKNGLGVGLCDELKKEQICKETGKEYTSYRKLRMLDSGAVSPYQDEDEILYEMVATGINSEIIVNFQNYTKGKKYSLLKEDYDKDYEVDGVTTNEIVPFIETDFLISELLNLQAIPENGKLKVRRVARKIDKDRYSALAYLLYFVEKYENVIEAKTENELLEYIYIN